ncbi:TTF-type domain-containing protein [Heracleum sosnowskyi]|uniref:TTF-type domain-containing protein n=1 Tax=Heracleum sosnowskyi TaxID=360622 RepID=A0AAD8MNE2_9APIA|nr:TTF-type domain-containing protein [Heracleum sosnowskyi]
MEAQGKERGKTLFSFFKPSASATATPTPTPINEVIAENPSNVDVEIVENQCVEPISKVQRVEIDLNTLERDPGIRIPIWQHPVNLRDDIRRAYIKMGPYQPKLAEYPRTIYGSQTQPRRFQYSWFENFRWLEYSPKKNSVFCFPCFIFQNKAPLHSALTIDGFNCWKRVNDGIRCPLLTHMGTPNSPHSNAVQCVEELMKVTGHIDKVLNTQSSEEVQKNRLRLKTTIECVRWLSLQACALRGHDESPTSSNRGNFIEMVRFCGRLNDNIGGIVLEKAPKNAKYTSPTIQKEVLHILADRVRRTIREEVGDAKFCILVDEAQDASNKEQMSIIFRFVDRFGILTERFFEIVQVPNTTASTLKKKISDVLSRFNLSSANLRGQGYDGASNMSGGCNGLQALFLKECPYAYYIHCFAHRLQLALVGASSKEVSVWLFFSKLSTIVNLIGCSPKWHTELHSVQSIEIARMVTSGERDTGRGINQIGNLHRSDSTRWSSHFDSICSLIDMYGATMSVLQSIVEEGSSISLRGEAAGSLIVMESFDFIFTLWQQDVHVNSKTR